jgi:hypothetical protein
LLALGVSKNLAITLAPFSSPSMFISALYVKMLAAKLKIGSLLTDIKFQLEFLEWCGAVSLVSYCKSKSLLNPCWAWYSHRPPAAPKTAL